LCARSLREYKDKRERERERERVRERALLEQAVVYITCREQ
jgi:hypothetical protein